ncbi:MAG: polysaccharide deacetylase family protein [Bacillota bacterium]
MNRLLALLFHDVFVDDPGESGFDGAGAARYKLPLADFDAQLAGLEAALPCPPALLAGAYREGPGTPVAITVDDGGVSYHSLVADRLEARGWRGHCFVTTGFIGRRGFLQKHHLRELHARGHGIGSHSVSHPARFSACAPRVMSREWSDSRRALQDILGADVTMASVPGGYFSSHVARAAAEAGLSVLFTSEPETQVREIAGCTVLGRFTARRGCPADYPARLVRGSPAARYGAWLAWNAKKALKAALGDAYPEIAGRVARLGRRP